MRLHLKPWDVYKYCIKVWGQKLKDGEQDVLGMESGRTQVRRKMPHDARINKLSGRSSTAPAHGTVYVLKVEPKA